LFIATGPSGESGRREDLRAQRSCVVSASSDRQPWTFIFDVDGTLVDSARAIIECWRGTLEELGHEFTFEQLHRFSGMDATEMLAHVLPEAELGKLTDAALALQAKRYQDIYLPHIKPFEGVRELFEELRAAGHRIGLATSCSPPELAVYQSCMNVQHLVDAVACGGDTARGKPHPDLFELVLHKLNPPTLHHVLAFGDTPYDAIAAAAVGIRTIGTVTGGFSQTQLEDAGCIAVALGPHDLAASLRAPGRFEEQFAFGV
jgi:HAD superfamily hydrolase (TIGR01549 family)